jgi:(p)ppGpp synthase/HD superfamily hydrolase
LFFFSHLSLAPKQSATDSVAPFPLRNAEEFVLLQKAVTLAQHVHARERRFAPAACIGHPLEVVRILAEASADLPAQTYIAATLHDILEYDRLRLNEIIKDFGDDVATMAWALSKPRAIPADDPQQQESEYVEQIARVSSTHPGVLLAKMADCIRRLESAKLSSCPDDERLLSDTREFYLPLFQQEFLHTTNTDRDAYGILLTRLESATTHQPLPSPQNQQIPC